MCISKEELSQAKLSIRTNEELKSLADGNMITTHLLNTSIYQGWTEAKKRGVKSAGLVQCADTSLLKTYMKGGYKSVSRWCTIFGHHLHNLYSQMFLYTG